MRVGDEKLYSVRDAYALDARPRTHSRHVLRSRPGVSCPSSPPPGAWPAPPPNRSTHPLASRRSCPPCRSCSPQFKPVLPPGLWPAVAAALCLGVAVLCIITRWPHRATPVIPGGSSGTLHWPSLRLAPLARPQYGSMHHSLRKVTKTQSVRPVPVSSCGRIGSSEGRAI